PFRDLRPAEDAGSAGGSSPARDRRHPRLSAARRRGAFHIKSSKSMKITDIPATPLAALRKGGVIPAHPLALDASRKLDERHQRARSRYYLDAGAIGMAVGVHTTQFEIRDHGLLEPVLSLAAEEAARHASQPFMVAGAIGRTEQAVREAELAREKGYHAVLLGLAAMRDASEDELIAHCRA